MPRLLDAFEQFGDNVMDSLAGGTIAFFKSGTSTPLITTADSAGTINNPAVITLAASGRPLVSTFSDSNAKAELRDSLGTLIKEVDPIGGEAVTGQFELFDLLITYDINETVRGSNGEYYISLTNGNLGSDPVTPFPLKWSNIKFLGVYNASETYASGDVVQESDGSLWASQVGSNLGNTPSADSGTNWLPAVTGAKIAEVTTLETRTTTVVPQTGGGTLTALRTNELQDADSGYLLPLANSVSANQTIRITLPERYTVGAIVTRTGSDTIEGTSSDTSITFLGPTAIELTSDGVSEWTL